MTDEEEYAPPETDADVESRLGDNTITHIAMLGLYHIYRAQGMNVLDAYMATLNRAIEVQTRVRQKPSPPALPLYDS